MSFAEIVEEIPRLTQSQRQELMRCLVGRNAAPVEGNMPKAGFRAEQKDGRFVLVAPRVIFQSEVDEILKDFP